MHIIGQSDKPLNFPKEFSQNQQMFINQCLHVFLAGDKKCIENIFLMLSGDKTVLPWYCDTLMLWCWDVDYHERKMEMCCLQKSTYYSRV